MTHPFNWLCIAVVLGLALGCEPSPPIHVVSGSDMTRPVTHPFELPERATPPPPRPEDAQTLAEYNKLLDAFLERSDEAFEKPETQTYLPGLERFFMATSRTFEMLDLYRKVYDDKGPNHYVGPRLAWAYISVGQTSMAQKVSEASLKHRPNDPMSHFVAGFLASRSGEPSAALIRKVRASWAKTLELDPNFQGPGSITARMLRLRIQDMDRALKEAGERPDSPPSSPKPISNALPKASEASNTPPNNDGPKDNSDTPPSTPTPEAPSTNPKLVEAETKLAFSDFSGAIQMFTEVLKQEPSNLRAEYGLTLATWKAPGQPNRDKALALLERVSKRTDLKAPQLYELGVIYARTVSNRERATALWQRAQKLDPDYARSVGLDKLLTP